MQNSYNVPESQDFQFNHNLFKYKNLQLTVKNKVNPLTQKGSRYSPTFFYSKKKLSEEKISSINKIWGKDDYFLGRSLDVFISRLRNYLKEDAKIEILNIHGTGLN